MAEPNDFFTFQSLTTFAGATGATVVIANGLQYVLDRNPRWLALIIAETVCVGTVLLNFISGTEPGEQIIASQIFVAVVNGFLVFSSAAGLSQMAPAVVGTVPPPAALERGDVTGETTARTRRGFWAPWF